MPNQLLSVRNNIGPANIVVPGTSAGLVSAAGLPGNTTGSPIAAGYVGQIINIALTNVAGGAGAWSTNGTILCTLTTGKWLVYPAATFTAQNTTQSCGIGTNSISPDSLVSVSAQNCNNAIAVQVPLPTIFLNVTGATQNLYGWVYNQTGNDNGTFFGICVRIA